MLTGVLVIPCTRRNHTLALRVNAVLASDYSDYLQRRTAIPCIFFSFQSY